MKKQKYNIAIITIVGMFLNVFPMFASITMATDNSSNVPECQFSGPPTAEQLKACETAAANQAQSSQSNTTNTPSTGSGYTMKLGSDGKVYCDYGGTTPTAEVKTQCESALASSQSAANTNGMPDFSKFGSMQNFEQGGPVPEFMGKALGGDGADQAAAQLGSALENIKEGLTQAEEGIQEMKEGGIKVDAAMEKSVKSAREIYNQAVALYESGDYMAIATKLGELEKVGFDKKFQSFSENNGVSIDLINDIRAKLKDAIKDIDTNIPDPAEATDAKADILTMQNYLDEAEKLLKAGKKKEASAILKKMKKENGDGEAAAMLGKKRGPSATQLQKILDTINAGLTRAGVGMEKIKDDSDTYKHALADLNKGKEIYDQAKKYFDEGDYTKTAELLKQLKELRLEEEFTAYKEKLISPDRMKMFLEEAKNGAKALRISIEKAKAYGVDTTELEKLAVTLDDLVSKAETAMNAKDVNTFLSYLDQARELGVKEKVDAAIRTVAMSRAKEILSEGLTAVRNAIEKLDNGINALVVKGGKTDTVKEIMNSVKIAVEKAQTAYDSGNYMNGGRILDDAVMGINKIANILNDAGQKLTAEQAQAVKDLLSKMTDANNLSNANTDTLSKAKNLFSNTGKDDIFDVKSAMMELNPALLDKIVSYRQKDQKVIDGVINDVVPLLSTEDQKDMLEGKIGLMDEAKSAEKTLTMVKQVKGIAKDSAQTLDSMNKQLKNYNFMPGVASKLEEKMANFNDKIQSKEVTNPKEINNYIKILKDDIDKGVKNSVNEKIKKNIIPAKNIDDNSPLFEEIKYLKDDGAIKADKKGEINLNQKIDGKILADMINKTMDEKAVNPTSKKNLTVSEVAQTVLKAYNIKAPVDLNNPGLAAKYLNQIGAEIKPGDIKQKADMADVAEILSAADQRWGQQ